MKKKPLRMRHRHAGIALCALVVSPIVYAANITWNNSSGDGLWGTAENWSTGKVPTTADTAILPLVGDGRITLDADHTVGAFRFDTTGVILDGQGQYKLHLTGNGMPNSASPSPKVAPAYILADIVLSNNVTWTSPNVHGNNVWTYGTIRDEGAGHSMTIAGTHNNNVTFGGLVDIKGEISTQVLKVTLGSRWEDSDGTVYSGGAITNAAGFYLDCLMTYADNSDSELHINNTVVADSDRIRGDVMLGAVRTGGKITLEGNAAVDIVERVKALDLKSGKLSIVAKGTSSATTNRTDFVVGEVRRAPGTVLELSLSNAGRFFADGAENTNGIWQPWCLSGGRYTKVNDAGAIVQTVDTDYATPAATGNDATKIYCFADAELALAENAAMYGLRWNRSSAQTLALGDHDLRLGSGALLITGNGNKTISSTGGALRFGGEDIIIYSRGNGKCEIGAPVQWDKPAGSSVEYPALIFADAGRVDGVVLDGEDFIGDYGALVGFTYNTSLRKIVFGGPSDRTFHGDVAGLMDIEKRGPGTLTFCGTNNARKSAVAVYEGLMRIAGSATPKPTVYDGGACEIAEGVEVPTNPTPSIQSGGMIMGAGTIRSNFSLADGAKMAGGSAGEIGTLTLCVGSATFTLNGNTTVAVKIDADENRAPTNSLVKVGNKLKFKADTELTLTVDVSDLSGGNAKVKDKTFTLMEWKTLENYDAELVSFAVTTSKPKRIFVDNARVVIDTAAKKMLLSGIEFAGGATLFVIR